MHNRALVALGEPLARAASAAAGVLASPDHPLRYRLRTNPALQWANRHRGWLVLAAGLLAVGCVLRRIRQRKHSALAGRWNEAPQARHGMTPARQ